MGVLTGVTAGAWGKDEADTTTTMLWVEGLISVAMEV